MFVICPKIYQNVKQKPFALKISVLSSVQNASGICGETLFMPRIFNRSWNLSREFTRVPQIQRHVLNILTEFPPFTKLREVKKQLCYRENLDVFKQRIRFMLI